MPTKSIAVWCEGQPTGARTEYEVHANYWRISGDADFNRSTNIVTSDLLEIGVRLVDVAAVDRIRLWVPFVVQREHLLDCSDHFNNMNIAQGIFNDVLRVTAAARNGPRCIELAGKSETLCRVHRFAKEGQVIDANELEVQDEAGGTMLTITGSALAIAKAAVTSPADTYFRLRMPTGRGQGLLTILPPRDHAFQSGYEVVEYIDFRLNEARTLPESVEVKMRGDQAEAGELKLVAFLAAVPILSNIAISSNQSHKMRVLEQELWTPYIGEALPPHMMVYHWKRERSATHSAVGTGESVTGPPIQDFSAFIKLSTRRSSQQTLLLYLAIAFIFGIFGNLSASMIEHFIGGEWSAVVKPPERGSDTSQNDREP